MKNTTAFGLVNETALNRIIRSADIVYWGTVDGFDVVSDGHAVFRVVMDKKYLRARFDSSPQEGKLLSSRKRGKSYDCGECPANALTSLKNILAEESGAEVLDTCLSVSGIKRLHIFCAQEQTTRHYAYIDEDFFDCISAYSAARAKKASENVPILFDNGPECAAILPVKVKECPAFLRDLAC